MTIAVKPVRPPSRTPDAHSTQTIMGVDPVHAAIIVPTADAMNAQMDPDISPVVGCIIFPKVANPNITPDMSKIHISTNAPIAGPNTEIRSISKTTNGTQ